MCSDDLCYGGTGVKNSKTVQAEKIKCEKKDYSIEMNLPPLSVTVYKFDYKEDKENKEDKVNKENKADKEGK